MRLVLLLILVCSVSLVAQPAPVQGPPVPLPPSNVTIDDSGVAKIGQPTPEDQWRALQRDRLLLNIKVIEAEACAASLDCAQTKLALLTQLAQLK